VGNPLREAFLRQALPAERFAGRQGPLRVLVVGGSLGAQALNQVVPQALALIPEPQRPLVLHQSGAKQIDALRAAYASAGVQAELTPFIDDTAQAFAQADLVIGRAGASTVTELAAVGVASWLVPFPHAVDDHQTTNARFLSDAGAAWLVPQAQLQASDLAERLQRLTREELLRMAQAAHAQRKLQAVDDMVQACEELAA
jgi:UDP-N-acetylglucosamine--N-acetylmuramyl-(pentapeptide) pyrophosphoryl-undecaprenol N-acetylglucosamine transferase